MVFWITWMFQPYRTKVKSGLSNYSNEPHPQIHQHGRLLTAIPHSTWAGKKWECLLLVIVCLIGIIMNITVGNIGVWLLFICHKLFDMYTPTCAPLSSHCPSSEVEYDLRRKGQKEGGVITRGVISTDQENTDRRDRPVYQSVTIKYTRCMLQEDPPSWVTLTMQQCIMCPLQACIWQAQKVQNCSCEDFSTEVSALSIMPMNPHCWRSHHSALLVSLATALANGYSSRHPPKYSREQQTVLVHCLVS